ncbi:hypothetical protein JD844_025807 [Phrynosoma platyrhinos]|uniref:4Fe-4S ferredoxin-type domain-containing protein n=1 Tax=Phrynosoma platyrhinos TaxID=52577 RepID=A0ABQ7SZT6_PHRPL|nr:hypothetical protein JD844_025807 [Phrynosoma platyrhinos]
MRCHICSAPLAGDEGTNTEPRKSWCTTTDSSRSWSTTTDFDRSWHTTTDSDRSCRTTTDSERRPLRSTSNTSLESIISLCSWTESSVGNKAKIPFSSSKTSLGSLISLCSWAESSAGDAACSSRSSGTVGSLVLEEDVQVLQPHKGRVKSRHLHQKPYSYPHVNFDLHPKEWKRGPAGATLWSSSMTRLIPATAPSLQHTTRSKGSPTHLKRHSWRISFLDYKQQELLEWHIHRKHQVKVTPPSRWASSTGTRPKSTIASGQHRGRLGPQQSLQKSHSYPHGDFCGKQKLLERNINEKYREKHAAPVHRVSTRKGRGQIAITDVPYWDEVGLHHYHQKPDPYSHNNFHPCQKELQKQREGPMRQTDSMHRMIPATPSLHSAIRGKDSHPHHGSRISFLSYKEQELLEWNVHKKQQQKDSVSSQWSFNPEAKKVGIAHGYQTHWTGIGPQHPPQKPHSYSRINSSFLEKELHRQHKGPTPQFHPLSKGTPTSASLQPTIKGKGSSSPAHFQGRRARSPADVAQGCQPLWGRVRPQRVHQKPHSYPYMGICEEQVLHDWAICKKINVQKNKGPSRRASSTEGGGTTRWFDSRTRLVPAAPSLQAKGKGSPAHLQEHNNRTGVLGSEEWELLAYNAHKKSQERSVTPLHQASSRAGGTPTLPSDLTTRLMITSPSIHPAGKGRGSPTHFQGSHRETRAQRFTDMPSGEKLQRASQQLPKAASPKAKLLAPSLPHSIMQSIDKEQVMWDLHMCLAQGLETGHGRPYVEYPVCLQCGRCTPFCPHPRSRRSPSLLVYPRLSVRKGEIHMSLGFLLKIKRCEADRWGLGPGVDASKMRLGREHPSRRERSRAITVDAGAERAQRQQRGQHRKGWETAHQHRGPEKSHSLARQHSADGVYLKNRDEDAPPGVRRVSFSASDRLSPKPSKSATKPSNHPHSKKLAPKEAKPHESKSHKKHPTILERLLSYMKKTWTKLGVKKVKKPPSKQGPVASSQKPHFSSSQPPAAKLNRMSSSSKQGHSHGHRRVSLQLPKDDVSPPVKTRESHHQAKSPSSKGSKQLFRKPSMTQLRP